MQWKNWGVMGSVAILIMAAMVGCSPIQPATPGAGETTTATGEQTQEEATSEATEEATEEPMEESTAEATEEATEESAADTTAETYDDPFAYCAAVGNVDAPDERYMGEELPMVILEGINDALSPDGSGDEADLEFLKIGTVWRCMDNEVWACNVGANLPCQAKADESTDPSQAMVDFCEENADSDFIPAVVTGRSTVYNWGCEDGEPVVLEQYTEVDSQGFLSFVWYKLTPPE